MIFEALAKSALFALVLHAPAAVTHAKGVTHYHGTLPDGATYLIDAPANWNGTVLLYSHGYVAPGQPNPPVDRSDPLTGQHLLAGGYALAGSSYASTGWAVHEALSDQMAVLNVFSQVVGQPRHSIAWGESMGGLITAGLIQQYPASFNGALPLCGALGGSVGTWNMLLDAAFAFDVLVAQSQLQLVNITNPGANLAAAQTQLNAAQNTPQGRARIALAAALDDIPGWFTIGSPRPAPSDVESQEMAQYLWLQQDDFMLGFDLRAELESRAGGNPSWNAGIDYAGQFAQTADQAEVEQLYTAAGLDLPTDLAALTAAAQISADPAALMYLSDNIIFDGSLSVPVLALQTQGDGLVVPEADTAYGTAVGQAGNAAFLRFASVQRAGHCAFTSGEIIAGFKALINRLDSGRWSGLSPATLNAAAAALGASYNPYPPEFATFTPGPFLRTDNGTPPQRARSPRTSAATRVRF